MLFYSVTMIADNLESVRQRIRRSCEKAGRSPEGVQLVCVTKEASVEEIEEVLRLGINIIGENRVQDAALKYKVIGDKASWHLVGHLQTNKVKDAVKIFSLIHSVDSTKLAKEIDAQAGKINKRQDILVQVNASGEGTKFGIKPEEALNFFKEISLYPNIIIKGLMTIAPETDDVGLIRLCLRRLRELRDRIYKSQITNHKPLLLSMGMTSDFEVAIEEGSDMVRIGRAIFRDKGQG